MGQGCTENLFPDSSLRADVVFRISLLLANVKSSVESQWALGMLFFRLLGLRTGAVTSQRASRRDSATKSKIHLKVQKAKIQCIKGDCLITCC